jgi:hypothetical protein
MMVTGKILLTCSPVPNFSNHCPTPTSYYEFDYFTNTFTQISAPGGGATRNISCYTTTLIDLPDGTVLYSEQGQTTFYIYTPDGSPLAAAKPVISKIRKAGANTYRLTGTLFNGISEGACYGDDWQMATNYPIVRLTNGNNVYYARTFNWNSTGVRRGSARDTVFITPPPGLPTGVSYALTVTANGITSNPLNVQTFAPGLPQSVIASDNIIADDFSTSLVKTNIFPNPAKTQTNIQFSLETDTHVLMKIIDVSGKERSTVINNDMQKGTYTRQINTGNLSAGVYFVRIITASGSENLKLVVQ